MPVTSIIDEIDAEILRLQEARVLLSGIEGTAKKAAPLAKKPAKRRRLSAAARKRIADAQRKRWAAIRAQKAKKAGPAKKASKKAPAKKAVVKKAPAAKSKKAAPKKTAPAPAPAAS